MVRRGAAEWTSWLDKHNTCCYINVNDGDGCASLVRSCGISCSDFIKHSPEPGLCVPFVPGQPKAPKPSPDGTCVTHSIEDSEECASRAKELGVTVDDLKKQNKGST
ncbi:glycoside hydrolase family 18 protein [Colletotrichum tofieldiae]|nr:glycoside hydrolase family 18 protein [Colletotrichum tofieldiae]